MHRVTFAIIFAMSLPLAGLAETTHTSGTCPGIDVIATARRADLFDLICETAIDQAARAGRQVFVQHAGEAREALG